MDSIHQAKVKSGHLLHKIALVQSQRNSTLSKMTIEGLISDLKNPLPTPLRSYTHVAGGLP